MSITSSYVFAACRAGSEPLLKADVARRFKDRLRPAFMRPQLVTWKSLEPLGDSFALGSVFARVSGLSFGLCRDATAIMSHVAPLMQTTIHLHVFPRTMSEDGVPDEAWAEVDAQRQRLAAHLNAAGLKLEAEFPPRIGEWVLDVIVGGQGELMLAGVHRHTLHHHPSPGAYPRGVIPSEAPSRAFLKMEQALAWARLDGKNALRDKTALELGCAPGGASYAMLRHGASVLGVDTAPVDDVVLNFEGVEGGRFRHLAVSVGALTEEALPKVDILVSDMNLAPAVALRYIERLQSRVNARLLVLTLKLNDRKVELSIPAFLKHISTFAPCPVRAMQLPANRREFCVLAGTLDA